MSRLLVIEDDDAVREMLARELAAAGHDVHGVGDGVRGLAAALSESPDVVLLDLRLPDADGEEVLRQLLAASEAPQVIVLTAHGTIDIAVRAMKAGAFDFIEKPCRLAELEAVIEKAARAAALERENSSLRRLLSSGAPVLLPADGDAAAFRREIEKIARSDLPVLITGETGAGKEVAARVVHASSPRAAGPFLVADCAALQPALIESELFGHERGAFTGAHAARPGLVECARGGTLFLDEIGELEPALQAKLLRLLESGEYRRVGGRESLVADARFVAATNRDLAAEVKAGRFREDLFYRLDVLTLRVAPLRERRDEIAPLARHFLARRAGERLRFDEAALELLSLYEWPGNVRELRNVVERMAVLVEGEVIGAADLPGEIRGGAAAARATATSAETAAGAEKSLAEVERRHVLAVLEELGGNKTRAAELLGISPSTLYNKLKKWGHS